MKESINIKLFLTVSLLLILVILTVLLLNTTVLEHYYRSQKELTLIDTYTSAKEYYSTHLIDTTSEFIEELKKIDSTRNIEIVVCDLDNNVLFSSSSNFLKNGFIIPKPFGSGFSEFSFNYLRNNLTNEKPYFIETFSDNKLHTDFMMLYGKLTPSYLIFIRTPLEAIRESVSISNSFLISVGSICVFISSIITFIISKAFTKPIKELNDIALSMSNLDFSKKYEVTTCDEIGALGTSINKLSDNLEKTIQDLKEANIDLEKDVEEKSKLTEMRSQFISDVSHELKTPIALIQGYAEGLVDGVVTDEESKKYYCEVILDEANKMSNLTKDLLDLSRLEYGNNELRLETFNITDLVATTLRKNELLFKEKNIESQFEYDKEIKVIADINRIEQVLTNYISNALKHVCNQNIIKCSINDLDDKVRVTVFNSGKNISDEDLARIWTRFYKVDSSRNRTTGGTGLGLSLVKAIMYQHKNKYGVNNTPEGVEFWFELDKYKNA
ncbi:MAG: HAMP domain-containing protein [Bacilli bacterium]|nr:HAMP domain-containing protein [Bacilli bacterium]